MSLTLYNSDVEMLKEIETDVQMVRDMAHDLNELLYKQKDNINYLETSIINTKNNIINSTNNINDATDDNNNYNKKILVGLTTSSILLTGLLMGSYVSIPIGLISIGGYLVYSRFK